MKNHLRKVVNISLCSFAQTHEELEAYDFWNIFTELSSEMQFSSIFELGLCFLRI